MYILYIRISLSLITSVFFDQFLKLTKPCRNLGYMFLLTVGSTDRLWLSIKNHLELDSNSMFTFLHQCYFSDLAKKGLI